MKRLFRFLSCALLLLVIAPEIPLLAQTAPQAGLHGIITDPSGGRIPGANVTVRSAAGEQKQVTNANGEYSFPRLAPGRYEVEFSAPDFKTEDRADVAVAVSTALDIQLTLDVTKQVVNVEEARAGVGVDPDANGSAIVLGQNELEALSDDPDELAQQLTALAGPGMGSGGPQIYTDGFSNGTIPPKSSIREIRINSNPVSAEYDSPGFSRIEILTKPGGDTWHGQLFTQYNNQDLNSRSPLFAGSSLPPYKNFFYNGSVGGPLRKDRASITFDFNRRSITENAFILATNLDSSFNAQSVNQALLQPQSLVTLTPRLDLAINGSNTLVVRYQYTHNEFDNQGVGGFSLSSTAYNQKTSASLLQVTETALLSPTLVNETRFQFSRNLSSNAVAQIAPQLVVQDSFTSGGARVGNSNNTTDRLELSNVFISNYKNHTMKWGGRARESFNNDTSVNNFNGTFTFFGGDGEQLDSNGLPIAGTSEQLTGLQVYQRTLQLQQAGLSPAQIRAAGGGASLFSVSAGTPLTRITQFDLGLFFNDDWKIRPNVTLSYGLRYETQTNIRDHKDFGPRLNLAWGLHGTDKNPAKTVLRAAAGAFYNRITDTTTLNAIRYNGITQQSYQITNPDFFPTVPSAASLTGSVQPQTVQLVANNIVTPLNYGMNLGVDRQINKAFRISINYFGIRGDHQIRQRDVNAPLPGTTIYPYGDTTVRLMTESSAMLRLNVLNINPTVSYKKLSLFGFYGVFSAHDDNEGLAANPYNLRAEWGPSSFDIRQRVTVGGNFPLWGKVMINPLIIYNSSVPYTLTTGLPDPDGDGSAVQRPQLLDTPAASCTGANLKFEPQFGCLNLNPAPGATLSRNSARGPGMTNMTLRIARTWGFVKKEAPAGTPAMPAGGPPPGFPGGPPGAPTPKKYNVTLSAFVMNPLNHPNFAAPVGDLSSPFFGQSLSLQSAFGPGNATYNRKITLQLQLSF